MRPSVALVFALVTFAALSIMALGLTSLLLNQDVIAVQLPGADDLGPLPGTFALALACGAFAGTLWPSLRHRHPSFWNALIVTVAVFLVYLFGLGVGVLTAAEDVSVAAAVVARAATTWFGLVIAGAALVSSWGAIALVRTRSHRPRWPWEHDDQ